MRYTAYSGTRYEYKTIVPERKKFSGKGYELAEVFPNFGPYKGHRNALGFAEQYREQGMLARVEAHSGYSAVYVRRRK